jgi:hypothetical protein
LSRAKSILDIQNNSSNYKDYSIFDFLTPIEYNLIASFHKKNTQTYIDRNSFSKKVISYMERVGLFKELNLESRWSYYSIFSWWNKNLIELTNIKDSGSADGVSKKFIYQLTKNFLSEKKEINEDGILPNVEYCLKELFNNVLDHSQDDISNYSSWHYFSWKYIQFAVVDSWIWIKNDLSNTFENIISHRQAIKKALIPWNSWKIKDGVSINKKPYSSKENAGIWLTAVTNIIKANGGDLVIWTWDYIYYYDGDTDEGSFMKIPNWNGVFVTFNMYCDKGNIWDYSTVLSNLQTLPPDKFILDQIKFS